MCRPRILEITVTRPSGAWRVEIWAQVQTRRQFTLEGFTVEAVSYSPARAALGAVRALLTRARYLRQLPGGHDL